MSNSNLKIDLYPQKDRHGNTFHIGKLKFNGSINCRDGIALLIFTSDEGNEQIQIAPMEKEAKGE